MDVRAFASRTFAQKTFFFCTASDGVKVLGPGGPPGYPPDIRGRSRPETLCLGCFSVPELVHMNFRENLYGPIPWCLAFRENPSGPMALKVRQKFPRRLALVHGWLFPDILNPEYFAMQLNSPQGNGKGNGDGNVRSAHKIRFHQECTEKNNAKTNIPRI